MMDVRVRVVDDDGNDIDNDNDNNNDFRQQIEDFEEEMQEQEEGVLPLIPTYENDDDDDLIVYNENDDDDDDLMGSIEDINVRENKINGEVLVDMERNDFGQNIAYMSGDKKMNGPSIKLYDELRKYKLETLHKESDVWCIDYKRYTTPLQIYDEEYKLELESVKENLDCLIKYDNNGDKVLPITEVQ